MRARVLRLLRSRIAVMLAVAMAVVLVLGSLLPAVSAEQSWRVIRSRGTLRVGTDPSWQPFSFYGAAGWEGLDADLAAALAARMGLRVEPIPVGFDGRYDALNTGLVDVAISAVVADPAQTQTAAFSVTYADVGPRLIVPVAAQFARADDLAGKRLGAARGSAADRAAHYWQRRLAAVDLIPFDDDATALQALRNGSIDAALIDGVEAMRIGCPPTGNGGGHAADWLCIAIAPNPYVVAMRASDTHMLAEVDAALRAFIADGTIERLRAKWVE
jgi:arginine/lysine/histidine transporter system substrate-binding protein